MIKKEYQQPVMEICQADMEEQLLVGSVIKVSTTGLDDDIEIDDTSDDAWENAL